jgi:hypothetical protein
MRTDICAREDVETQTTLLKSIGGLGAMPDDDMGSEVPLPIGLHRFTGPDGTLTVFVDAWGVDLEGPDELVRRVLAAMASD